MWEKANAGRMKWGSDGAIARHEHVYKYDDERLPTARDTPLDTLWRL
jgi:hypothetical protein